MPPQSAASPTISTSDSVQEAWVRHFGSGLAPSEDRATAMAVDASGNVYVTGYSTKVPFGIDYFTVKYDASGNEVWAIRYDAGVHDVATAIAVDGEGNVYVTGYSVVGSGTWTDYATIKYNASGVQEWAARYNGTGGYEDRATAIAVDGAGNVYVTGGSYGSGTYVDYATIKYTASGIQQWAARYNGPGNDFDIATAIAVDAAGNVYVTGYSYDSGTYDDYATIKYNASGVEQWAARYNGPGNDFDIATAIAVDAAGNVYVTGWSYGSGTYNDYATIKYNTSGIEQWVAYYNGPGNGWEYAAAIAVDAGGNVYVTGWSSGSGTVYDYATIKYNASGVQQWVARYNGPGNDWDMGIAITVDDVGNVYVTGYSVGSGTSYDCATIKYNASGVQQWVARYNGPGNGWDEAGAIAVDAAGNVYVTGWSYGSGTYNDYATIKYNASGIEQWVARFNVHAYDAATAIALDAAGNVYVTGTSQFGPWRDYATIKYNPSGILQWVAYYNGPGNSWDGATAIAVDAAGNVYVTGYSYDGSGTSQDYATIKYNASGVEQWAARYNGPRNYDDYAAAIAVDGAGNVYVTGTSYGAGWSVYTTIKYTQEPTSVGEGEPLPSRYELAQNYPNPFNPNTIIEFAIPELSNVKLTVYNILGQEVAVLINSQIEAGYQSITWNAQSNSGAVLSSGIYLYRLEATSRVSDKHFNQINKMLFVK